MNLQWDLLDKNIVKIDGWVICLSDFTRETGLFVRVRIKTHFPLERPVAYFTEITIQISCRNAYIMNKETNGSIVEKELGIC